MPGLLTSNPTLPFLVRTEIGPPIARVSLALEFLRGRHTHQSFNPDSTTTKVQNAISIVKFSQSAIHLRPRRSSGLLVQTGFAITLFKLPDHINFRGTSPLPAGSKK